MALRVEIEIVAIRPKRKLAVLIEERLTDKGQNTTSSPTLRCKSCRTYLSPRTDGFVIREPQMEERNSDCRIDYLIIYTQFLTVKDELIRKLRQDSWLGIFCLYLIDIPPESYHEIVVGTIIKTLYTILLKIVQKSFEEQQANVYRSISIELRMIERFQANGTNICEGNQSVNNRYSFTDIDIETPFEQHLFRELTSRILQQGVFHDDVILTMEDIKKTITETGLKGYDCFDVFCHFNNAVGIMIKYFHSRTTFAMKEKDLSFKSMKKTLREANITKEKPSEGKPKRFPAAPCYFPLLIELAKLSCHHTKMDQTRYIPYSKLSSESQREVCRCINWSQHEYGRGKLEASLIPYASNNNEEMAVLESLIGILIPTTVSRRSFQPKTLKIFISY
ncbi:hypothetical protein RF11_01709 [Thelohanellus kitauei]|uniref:Uncharacterized protein n=1 Tax=Thelohanellus kitauei TaxID=669202 RepID=A0A0C2MYW1_THEKT|nr:hypothetical protein RF11_01709 [Thelohanellus kitauei]